MIPPLLAAGLVYASGLALAACGITMIYMCTRTFNFAHANMATWGAYTVYTCLMFWKGLPYAYWPLAFLVGAVLGAVCYYTINGPLLRRKASDVTLMMSTLGYDLVLLSIVGMYVEFFERTYHPPMTPRMASLSAYDVKILGMPAAAIISPILAVGLVAGLYIFMTKAKFGIALRATVENPDLAGVVGINSDRVYLASWIIGGGLASLGGAVMAMAVTVNIVFGMTAIVPMFASSILGGLHSVYGAVLGGMVVGLAEYGITYLLSLWLGGMVHAYRAVIPLMIMAATLMAFPRGLAGVPWGKLLGRLRALRGGLGGVAPRGAGGER